MSFLVFPGSSPLLSSAEARAQFPEASWRLLSSCFLTETPLKNALPKLAGATKIAKVIMRVPTKECTATLLADWVKLHPRGEGKLIFALTWIGSSSIGRRLPIELKQALRTATERSVRWFESAEGVSSAAIQKLGLIEEGYDFTILEEGDTAWIAVTTEVQDLDFWSSFDMDRPRRNAKNGMTPPKLASLMLHLAGTPKSLLDPFCGSGTFLAVAGMEELPRVYGSDILPRIIDDAKANIAWAQEAGMIRETSTIQLTVADATKPLPLDEGSIDAIVTEGYLGTPLHGDEEQPELDREAHGVKTLWRDALPHLYRVLTSHGVIIASWPSYKTPHGQARVTFSETELRDAGFAYEPLPIVDGSYKQELPYARNGQFVGRTIVRLRKTT